MQKDNEACSFINLVFRYLDLVKIFMQHVQGD